MSGPPPKPTALKLVTGNPGRRPLNKREPKPRGNLRDPPDWLTESQRKSWEYAIETAPYGLLKRIDRSVLVAWVVAEDLHRQAAEKLNGGAMLVKTPNGMPVQTPYLSIVNKQALIMLRAAGEMGFTATGGLPLGGEVVGQWQGEPDGRAMLYSSALLRGT